MNEHTLRKLAANPNYKLNRRQKAELDQLDAEFEAFGDIEKHETEFQHHPTGIVRRHSVNRRKMPVQDSEQEA